MRCDAERLRQLLSDIRSPSSQNVNLSAGNDQFRRGDRVVIEADPHQFRDLQTDRYGGWNDDMALVSHPHAD